MIELLSHSTDGGVRFSDVVAELGLTQATAHAILTTLCDRGWASRDPITKSFTLGPAFTAVAARADAARPLVHAAREASRNLSRDVGYPASVVERAGDSVVITAFETVDEAMPSATPGERLPYAPPFGIAFAAWDSEAEQRVWMQRSGIINADLTRRLRDVLTRTRRRGYDIDWTTPALAQAMQALSKLHTDELPGQIRTIMDQLLVECATVGLISDDQGSHRGQPIATISAPVFDDRSRVALIVGVHPLRILTERQIASIGRRLTSVTTALSVARRS